jgi:DNA-directed RNA polymerase subunit RPC12/RpoP
MDSIDVEYINLLSSRLERFKKVRSGLYNCRCIICGDSYKHKTKARGYFYQKGNNTNYKCHNCGVNISLNNFLKQVDCLLHENYCLEKYKRGITGKNFVTNFPTILKAKKIKFNQT